MAHDLVFGHTRRNFSRDSVGAALLPTPDLSTKASLDRQIKYKYPELPAQPAADRLVFEKIRETAPETMRAYDKLQPTYKDHKVILRMKTDLLGP